MAAASKTFDAQDSRPLKLFFQDEARFGRSCEPVNCWCPKGLRPLVLSQIVRQYTHVFSAVCPSDGESFSLILPYADTDAMRTFLDLFLERYHDYRVLMVLDRAAWHRSYGLGTFENLRLIYQPPYSPEVNPVEHLWEYIREKFFRNTLWHSLDTLENSLEGILKSLMDKKNDLQSLVGFHWAIFNL